MRMSEEQARALGLIPDKRKPKTTGKRTPPAECLPNRCLTCGEVFTGEAAERRHSDDLNHHRFEAVLPEESNGTQAEPNAR